MATKESVNPFQKQVHSMLRNTILIVAVLFVIVLLYIIYAVNNASTLVHPKIAYSTSSASPTPAPSFNPAYFLLTPTPTLAPGQKAVYTFYIQATSHKTSNGELTLNPSDTGKVFTTDIGSLIILHFGGGNFHISDSSPQDILEAAGSKHSPIHLPLNSIGAFNIVRLGFGTITVIETE
jgi:hypothetical protein